MNYEAWQDDGKESQYVETYNSADAAIAAMIEYDGRGATYRIYDELGDVVAFVAFVDGQWTSGKY